MLRRFIILRGSKVSQLTRILLNPLLPVVSIPAVRFMTKHPVVTVRRNIDELEQSSLKGVLIYFTLDQLLLQLPNRLLYLREMDHISVSVSLTFALG
jgi:hypothetical protein